MLPGISITNNIPTLIIPLLFTLFLTSVHDLSLDFKKRASDRKVNKSKLNVYRKNREKQSNWDNIYPGHIIIIKDGEKVPADCVLIYSSSFNSKQCQIATLNIDGDTNLKTKKMINGGDGLTETATKSYVNFFVNSKLTYEKESANMTSFKAQLELVDKQIPITIDNLLFRGSTLKNTDYVYCVVVYTGKNTKI